MSRIESFSGEYRFLSNFYPAAVHLDGVVYPTVEHAYQAAKTLDPEERETIRLSPSPSIAKKLGRHLRMRQDWEEIKLETMALLVIEKFETNIDLATKLLGTGQAELVEGNWWGDTYWGVCRGKGENNLGRILMATRQQLAKEKQDEHGCA